MGFTKATSDYLDSGGIIKWITTPKTADFTAISKEGYFINTTSAAITVTLPSGPTTGDEVSIVDYAGTADTNNIIITSSDNINGSSNDVLIDYERGGVSMVYADATQGWIAYNAANETATALEPPTVLVDYLVVAGGGGGISLTAGGGGAGGLRTSYTNSSSLNGHNESTLTLTTGTNYTVTVGPGGSGTSSFSSGNNGTASVFHDKTSTGGGYGGARSYFGPSSGGSGGGGASDSNTTRNTGAAAVTSPVTQGFAGGDGADGGTYQGGGGGGAAAVGTRPNGGAGLAVNIINTTNATTSSVGEVSGSDVYFAGGGGAGANSGAGSGGIGGGANGSTTWTLQNATANTGGGGGSGATTGTLSGGNGGSGVVILRYPDAYTISETTSPSVLTFNTYTEGSDKVTVFTAGESGTIQFS